MPESSRSGPTASRSRSRKSGCSGSSSAASAGWSTSGMAIEAEIDAKHTIDVPSRARGRSASTRKAVPTRSTVNTSRQSAMVGETPAAWATARSGPSSLARAARRTTASRSLTSRTNVSMTALGCVADSRFPAAARLTSSRSTRISASTMSLTRSAHAAPMPRPAPVTMPTVMSVSPPPTGSRGLSLRSSKQPPPCPARWHRVPRGSPRVPRPPWPRPTSSRSRHASGTASPAATW